MRPHATVHGPADAPTVVLVHGAPDRAASFRRLLPHLEDVRVVTYDRRGYGQSVHLPPPTCMRDHAEDLLAVIDGQDEPPVVVAHSFGSNPTMLAATLRPEAFLRLGLWEPPLPWVHWWPERVRRYNTELSASADPGAALETMTRRLVGNRRWESWSADQQDERRAEGVAFQVDMASELTTPFEFDDVKVPALVGYGTETSAEHVRGATWLAEQLPDARLLAVPGAGHFAPRTHPEDFAGFVRAALSP